MARFGRACVWQSENTGFGTFGCWRCCIVLSGQQDCPSAHPRYGNIRARLRQRRHHTAGPLKAKLAVCPLVQGHYEGFLFRRSWRSARPTGVFGTQWFARALASPRRVHRFDLEVFPKQTVLAPAPLSLAPTGAAGQKTARILDMNGGEPLFFKVLKGESISPFNIWKWQRAFVGVSLKNF